ncbi:MAG: glucosamine-6-phosphate deaminase [Candidatus Firestonebacteria bacterium]
MRNYVNSSKVEEFALKTSGKEPLYAPTEKIKLIEVPDFPSLGKLTAMRFLEWLTLNPEGVVTLPTGKTPEHFIKWTNHYIANWETTAAQRELGAQGINTSKKPRMGAYSFVQIDEFYPLNPAQENSFAFYINRFYFKEFGLDPKKALLLDCWKKGAPRGKDLGAVFPGKVDLSLRHRKPINEAERAQADAITAADQYCMEYEEQIVKLGGIGFFLGGIGPDGHIGFNIRGSDHFSTTRLIPINYETAASAAGDLGGIEISRHKVVITIGLRTITRNETSTAIIIAAGESKAKVVRDAVEREPNVLYPATSLQQLSGARFYATKGAACRLSERQFQELSSNPKLSYRKQEKILIDISFRDKIKLKELTSRNAAADRLGSLLLKKNVQIETVANKIDADLKKRILKGVETLEDLNFLHTAPHHDDIMLGYMPYILHLVRSARNSHHFATLTSGFTSVTNIYILQFIRNLESFLEKGGLEELIKKGYFSPGDLKSKNRDIYQFLDGVAANSAEMQREGEARRFLRNLIELTGTDNLALLRKELKNISEYFITAYPGKKDSPVIQKLKGMIREWEEELLWGHLGFDCSYVHHLRLGFYTGDIFTQNPETDRDVKPTLALMEKTRPDVITVAMDPEASGPDTHYKILQTISEALKLYLAADKTRRVKIWGYRNVWFRFHPSEADIFVPVSMNSFASTKSAFLECYGSQRAASFPSYEYDGPFCDLAQKIMVEQYSVMKACLGRDFFYSSSIPRLRATRGMVFMRSMTPEEFFKEADTLKKLTE